MLVVKLLEEGEVGESGGDPDMVKED